MMGSGFYHRVQGKRVLLKPNLVEYSPKATINTHPLVIAAAVDSLYRLGAADVVVADGPGHVRDSDLLLEESGLKRHLAEVGGARFVDLNSIPLRKSCLAEASLLSASFGCLKVSSRRR